MNGSANGTEKAVVAGTAAYDRDKYHSRIAFVGNYLPRRCGIATFTSDLCTALSGNSTECLAVAMNDRSERYDYPRGGSWVFAPEAAYEREGDVGNVVFPCGFTVGPDNDTINLYYGAGDTCIGLATGSIRASLAWLDRHSETAHPAVDI